MHQAVTYSGNRVEDYRLAREQVVSLWEQGLPLCSNLANVSALLKEYLDRTNWVGFYLWEPDRAELVVGPFQGLPACTRIPAGRGVCGTAVKTRQTQRVEDVHAFAGHIACDGASVSEIVVPLIRDDGTGEILGVLDIDSPVKSRFDPTDEEGLQGIAAALVSLWPASIR